MNDQKIIDDMIVFIENLEKDLQASKMTSDARTNGRTEVVNSILEKLDEEYNNEN